MKKLGTLNLIDDAKRLAALQSVRRGDVVTLGRKLLINWSQQQRPSAVGSWRRDSISAFDTIGLDVHGYEVTHLDALGHVFLDERTWGDREVSAVLGSNGLSFGSILAAGERAIVTRGVLLDICAVRGVDWLLPTDGISVADLEAAMAAAGVTVGTGDAVFVRSGATRCEPRPRVTRMTRRRFTKASCRTQSVGCGIATLPSMPATASSSVRPATNGCECHSTRLGWR